jgi:hypothetical protein
MPFSWDVCNLAQPRRSLYSYAVPNEGDWISVAKDADLASRKDAMSPIVGKPLPKLPERSLTRIVPRGHGSLLRRPPTVNSLQEIVSRGWATSESRLENWAP